MHLFFVIALEGTVSHGKIGVDGPKRYLHGSPTSEELALILALILFHVPVLMSELVRRQRAK